MQKSLSGGKNPRILLWIISIAFFMQMLDGSILNTALPAMAAALRTDPLRMHSVVIAYMLTTAVVIPASGFIADRFGIRRVFLFSVLVFTAGSAACAASSSLGALVAARVAQGIGGALMVPVGRLAVLRAFPRSELAEALSFVTLPGLLGPLLGPLLGGLLVSWASWEWIFLINIPVGLLGFFLALRHMPAQAAENVSDPFDYAGFLLLAFFMVSMSVSAEGFGEHGLLPGGFLAPGVVSLLCLAAYVFYCRRAAAPLISPGLFDIANFRIGILGNIFARLGFGAMPFLVPLLLQVGLGYSPLAAGLAMLPISFGAIAAKAVISGLIGRLGFRVVLTANTALLGAALAAHSLLGLSAPMPFMVLLFIVAGAASSMQFTSMNSITLIDLPDDRAGAGNSLLSAVMQLAMSMGVAVAAAVLDVFKNATGEVLSAFQHTFFLLGLFTAFTALIFLRVRDTSGYVDPAHTLDRER
ncbi:MAG: DHA2 family efflux MFS transporter permease subunit [Desulfovibrio sp.]|jgi:EmrB/QacA subfamily drug resistance transporter|nr:DHA2 family efflux MFS transporter permease subunit [Desulfovibrio sp.]